MTETKSLPRSGYALERVFTTQMEYKMVPAADDAAEGDTNRLSFGWDWRIVGADVFDVSITVQTHPTKQRAEAVQVSLVGRFRRVGDTQTIDARRFSELNAPALLMPYARETISSLTGRGIHGSLFIPPVNVIALMASINTQESTGAKQLAGDPSMALSFPIAVESSATPRLKQPE